MCGRVPAHASHNLAELLTKLSPRFAEGFKYLLHVYFDAQSLDYAPAPLPVVPWLAHREEHTLDVHRAEMDTIHYHVSELSYSPLPTPSPPHFYLPHPLTG